MKIKLAVFDVDGVLTDGTISYTADGETLKTFHAHDGFGLNLLMKAGIAVGVISGRESAPLERRMADLNIRRLYMGCRDKVAALEEMCRDIDCDLSEIAYMGDDLIDYKAMQAVGMKLAPANAVADIKTIADHITQASGGAGAVREAAEYLLLRAGIKPLDIASGVFKQ